MTEMDRAALAETFEPPPAVRTKFQRWADGLNTMAKLRARHAEPLAKPTPMEPSDRAVIAYERAIRRCAERWA